MSAAPVPGGMAAGRQRLPLVDALRALALFGILQVNIQSYLWGASDPLGYFVVPPRLIDTAAYLAVGTFVSLKFLSLFALLFGYGFALQMRSLQQRLDLRDARRAYRRRMAFLLLIGVAHGLLLYYGDILTAYAVAGLILVTLASGRSARLLTLTRWFWVIHAVVSVAFIWLLAEARRLMPEIEHPEALPPELIDNYAVSLSGSYLQQLPYRVADYISLQATTLSTSLPFILGLFTLGALAARQGWLRRPQRFARLWRWARGLGVLGLMLSALGTWLNYRSVLEHPSDPSLAGYALMTAGFPAVALYLAWVVRHQHERWMAHLIVWLAPAGRMPLTNYLLQSFLMGALLSGWGLGWGQVLGRAELAALALIIAAAQVLLSRVWIQRWHQGPIEALWRRATYRRPAAGASMR